MIDDPGKQLDAYQLIRRLGSGTFGDVYEATDMRRNERVAVKVMEPLKTPKDVQHFLAEVRALVRLRHRHIIPILDFGVDPARGIPFIVMPYASDGSLRQRHPKGTRLPLATVVQYVKQLAEALQYAHDDRSIHRDLKPDNVLLGSSGELLLSDFGISTPSSSLLIDLNQPELQNVAGSPRYMAPEQCQGKPEKASDQYALAIMVYEWLTGYPPFTEGNPINIQFQHTYEPVLPLRGKVPEIPSAVEEVVMRALAKKPEDRFASVQAFADELETACKLPGEEYYLEHVSRALREYYYQSNEIMRHLGAPKVISKEDGLKIHSRGTSGYKRPFTHGSIYWSERSGAQPVWWGIDGLHRRHKGVQGIMGFPLTAELEAAPSPQETTGVFQRFEGERDYPEDIPAVPVRYGASAYYSKKYGSRLTSGGMGVCYERLGGTSGKLGFPTSRSLHVGPSQHPTKTKGMYKNFEGGRIYWSQRTGAHPVWDSVADLYHGLGGAESRLGFPISDEMPADTSPRETTGTVQHFEGGSSDGWPTEDVTDHSRGVPVYSSKHGAYPVLGAIGICYERLGGTRSHLGFPTALEKKVDASPQGTEGWYQHFEGGDIHWCEPYGSVVVTDSILEVFQAFEGASGKFGFPKSSEVAAGHHPTMMQAFEGGVIAVLRRTPTQMEHPQPILIEVKGGDPLSEPVEAVVNSHNNWLQPGSGLAVEINERGGPTIQDECNAIIAGNGGSLPLGTAVLTGAGKLTGRAGHRRYIIHAVGMGYTARDNTSDKKKEKILATPETVADAVRAALILANTKRIASLALPLMCAREGYSIIEPAKAPTTMLGAMIEAIQQFSMGENTSITRVVICLEERRKDKAELLANAARLGAQTIQ